jgi:hypothetical protein
VLYCALRIEFLSKIQFELSLWGLNIKFILVSFLSVCDVDIKIYCDSELILKNLLLEFIWNPLEVESTRENVSTLQNDTELEEIHSRI